MQSVTTPELSREFRYRAEALRRERQMRHYEQQRQDQKDAELEAAEADALMDAVTTMLTTAEITEFRQELDLYDTATVAALQENDRALTETQQRMDELLDEAYVLPDDRRVFKSKDGVRVFDEHGAAVGSSTLDPDLINDNRPIWETYKPLLNQKNNLLAEREALHSYQARLDEARERLDSGELTRTDYVKLRKELKQEMPDAVRHQIEKLEGKPEAPRQHVVEADTLDLGAKVTPTSFAPKLQ